MNRSDSYIDEDEKKADITQVEDVNEPRDGEIPVSAFVNLTTGQTVRKFWRLYAHALMIALGTLYVGYAVAIGGSIIANPGFIEVFGVDAPAPAAAAHRRAAGAADPNARKMLNPTHVSLWGGLNLSAQLVMQLASGILVDRYGRRLGLYAMTGLVALTIVLEIVAKDWKVYLAARMTSGMACAWMVALGTYVADIAMPSARGAFMTPFVSCYAGGSLLAAIALKIVAANPSHFRRAFYSQFVFLGLWIIPLIFMPETPMWLAKKGRHEDAKKALRRLVGNVEGYDIEHEYKVIEYEVTKSEQQAAAASAIGWIAVLKWRNFKRILISAIPFMSQGPLGAALTFGYATYFFLLAGIPDPFLANVMQNTILIVGVVLSFFTQDRFGRRPLMLIGTAGCCLCVFGIAGFSYIPLPSQAGSRGIVACVCLWMAFYSSSVLPLSWSLLTELSTVSLRAKSVGMGNALASSVQLIFQFTIPIMLGQRQWGAKIGFLFGGLGAIIFVLVFLLIPETKQRAPQEIDELYERKIPAWKWSTTTTALQQAVEDQKANRTQGTA